MTGEGHGRSVVVVGPDGTGKSSVVDTLLEQELSGPVLRLHHRPRLLGGLSSHEGVVTEPHRAAPYPRWLTVGKLLFLFLDHLLGWLLRVRPWLRSGGDVVMERGWWDLAVDPRRYRLQPSPRLVALLGRLLPRPDVTVVLGGDPAVVAARKGELSVTETARQLDAWRSLPERVLRADHIDTARPLAEVHAAVAAAVRQGGRADRWVTLPTRSSPRWHLPAAPRRAAVSSLGIYDPMTSRGLLGWQLTRGIAAVGGFQLLARRGGGPPARTMELLAPHAPAGSRVAVAHGNHPGRSTALVIDATSGAPSAFLKIAQDPAGPAALAAEARARREVAALLPADLHVPEVTVEGEQVLVFEPVAASPRTRPWLLPEEVAFALGRLYRAGARTDGCGPAHGDCAPWNLLRSGGRWYLVDWSDWRPDAPPFEDVLHYLVQAHALLGRPRRQTLLAGLDGRGPVGEVLRRYAEGAELDPSLARELAPRYLERTCHTLDPSLADGAIGRRAREALLRELLQGARR